MSGNIPMTPSGLRKLKEELKLLQTVERGKISREIEVARAHGDLRENAEYHAAKEKQGMIEARITDLEDKLSRAEVIDTAKLGGHTVKFGAYVQLEDVDSGKIVSYRIVGP
ncbi:MAG TPA: transcription elongation factor GreA, partial [Aggregicoccus sp.]|nr:transcription elongation factor GreA [Aggregicoccus sp.]